MMPLGFWAASGVLSLAGFKGLSGVRIGFC